MPAQTTPRLPAAVCELPPSAKLVLYVLLEEGEGTLDDLAAESRLPPRTVRYAPTRLETAGLVSSRPDLRDARRSIFTVTDAATEG